MLKGSAARAAAIALRASRATIPSVEGVRGKGGGYRLTRPPEDYSVGEILRLAEGSLAPVACLDCGSDPCARAGSCRTRPLWERLDALICGYLDQVTLADLLSAPGSDSSPC